MRKIKIDGGKVLLRDIIQSPSFSKKEEDWVINFDFDKEIPEILSEFRRLKPYRKLFIVRDLYKNFCKEDTTMDLYPEGLWWFDIIISPEISFLKKITKNKQVLSRLFANIIASEINYDVVNLQKKLAEKLNNQNSQSQQDILYSQDIQENINSIKEKIKKVVEKLPVLMKEKGIGVAFPLEEEEKWKEIKIPRNLYTKLKNITSNICGYYYSLEKTQTYKSYPRVPDWYFADDYLFLTQIPYFYDTEFRTKKIKLDAYIDTSGSMSGEKILFAKGVLKELKKEIKFTKIYRFSTELQEIKLNDVLQLKGDGGTEIKNVLKNVLKRNKNSLIITDLEDNLDEEMKNLITKTKNKISVIQIGTRKVYEDWNKIVGIAFFIEMS